MDKKQSAQLTAVIGIGIVSINQLAHHFAWYEVYTRFDVLMHFLGGVFAFLFVFTYLYKEKTLSVFPKKVFIGTASIALLWEVYEFGTQTIVGAELITAKDTIEDILVDMVGAFVIYKVLFFVESRKKRYNKTNGA